MKDIEKISEKVAAFHRESVFRLDVKVEDTPRQREYPGGSVVMAKVNPAGLFTDMLVKALVNADRMFKKAQNTSDRYGQGDYVRSSWDVENGVLVTELHSAVPSEEMRKAI